MECRDSELNSLTLVFPVAEAFAEAVLHNCVVSVRAVVNFSGFISCIAGGSAGHTWLSVSLAGPLNLQRLP